MKQASNAGTGKRLKRTVNEFSLQVDERRVVEAAQALLLRQECQLDLFAS